MRGMQRRVTNFSDNQREKGIEMRNSSVGIGIAVCALVLGLGSAVPTRAQSSGQQQQPPAANPPGSQSKPAAGSQTQAAPAEAPKANPQEEADYKAFGALKPDAI